MKDRNVTRIVICGSGFGGVYTYMNLHKQLHGRDDIEVIMVSEDDHFLFSPLLHEVAVGNLPPHSITQPARTVPQCCLDRFITGEVHAFDPDNKTIRYDRLPDDANTKDVIEEDTLSYDYLVMALGSDTDYYGTPGAEDYALPLKRLDDASAIKNSIVQQFEKAQRIEDRHEKKSALRFVIVGGGATGVELAGELGDLFENEMHESFPRLCELASIHLYEGGDRLLGQMDEWFSQKVETILDKREHVHIHTNTLVEEVYDHGVLANTEMMYADTVMWTAGVKAQALHIAASKQVATEPRTGRIHVTDCLHLQAYPNVFVVGDQAWIKNKETGQPYPMRAQFAVREGQTAAKNIKAALSGSPCTEFYWRDKGIILSLGKGGALAKVYGYHFSGIAAWIIYRLVYLMQIPGLRYKFRTLVEWIGNLFGPRDISKI
jgi:NADH dehydrogenase